MRKMSKHLQGILWILLVFVGPGSGSLLAAQNPGFDHSVWDNLLHHGVRVITDGTASQVDYDWMKANEQALDQYLSSLSAVDKPQFDSWSEREQLAFLINSYNSWTVKLILSRYPDIDSIKDLGSFFRSPWKKTFIPLFGQNVSLDTIEHELIRGSDRYRDWRIHFAVNCASIGCPALRPEAYRGDRLDFQLEDNARRFLADSSRNRIRGTVLEVSSIFKWYREDFERGDLGIHSLVELFLRYREPLKLSAHDVQRLQAGEVKIEFLDYDWRLNRIP